MYLLRRITKTQQGKAWDVANLMSKICAAYEENGVTKLRCSCRRAFPAPEPRRVESP